MHDVIGKIKEALPVAGFFEQHYSLSFRQAGEQLVALCPFHPDEHPSLTVNAQKGVWHCHGCGKGGDVITAIELYLGGDFKQALEWAAQQTGVSLPTPTQGKARPPLVKAVPEYHVKLRQSTQALEWLINPEGKRRLTMETLSRFQVGFDGTYYCIPLCSATGMPLNAKLIHPDKTHEPRQKFYVRGKVVGWFPMDVFSQHSELVAVGGEWDTMRAQQEGISNAVCWTTGEGGLTPAMAREAKDKRITLLLDADAPGRTATRRAAAVLAQAGASVMVVDWTEGAWGKDVTDFLKTYPVEELRRVISEAVEPSGGTASMGGYTYWEAPDGYYRQKDGKDDSIRLTDFCIRYSAIWKPHGGQEPPCIEGTVLKGKEAHKFYWKTDVLADSRMFRQELLRLSPKFSFSLAHLPELISLLAEFNVACPVYDSVTGPGYTGESYVTPSVIVRGGQCKENKGEIVVINDSPFVQAYDLTMPPEDVHGKRAATEALLQLLGVHDFAVTIRLLSHFMLAPVLKPLSAVPYTLYLTGPTGAGKTMLSKCMMNLFMDLDPFAAEHGRMLSAQSTANSLERIGWHIQDAPVLIDDVKSGLTDMAGISRLVQHHYDAHGRSRLKATLEVQQDYFVRGLMVLTGEQLPHLKGPHASVIRRGLIVEVPPEGLRLEAAARIASLSQLLRGLTAGFIAWSQVSTPPTTGQATPSSTAERFSNQALAALEWFLTFCVTWGLEGSNVSGLLDVARRAFGVAVGDSEHEQAGLEDYAMFLSSLREGLASGRLTLEAPVRGERRVGCWWNGKLCLFPGEVSRWTQETSGMVLSANFMGRSLKAQGLLHLGQKDTPTTVINFEGRSVAVWVLSETIDLITLPAPAEEQKDLLNRFKDL